MTILLLAACVGLQTLEPPDKQQGDSDTSGSVTLGGIEVSTSAIDFGEVELDATVFEPITLHNAGGESVNVLASLSGSSRFELDAASIELAAARDEVLTVRFTPDMESEFEATLTLETEAGASVDVALSGTGSIGGDTGGPDDTGTTPSGEGDISVSATSLDYGSLDVGDSLSRTVTVTNNGDADLEIDAAGTSNSAFVVSGDFTSDRTLAPGTSKILQVDFKPTSAGGFTGYVELNSNDPDSPSTRVSLSGEAIDGCDICAPLIDIDTGGSDAYAISDFFSLIGPDTRTITIQNIGDMDLVVSNVTVTNDFLAPCGEFSLSGWSAAETLSPYAVTTFSIAYDTSDVCLDVAQDSIDMNVVHIFSNDPGEPDYVIALAGTGF